MKKEGSQLFIRNSRKHYIGFYVMIAILFCLLAYIYFSRKSLNQLSVNLVIIFSLFVIIFTELHRLGNSYQITNRSIVHNNGYFSVSSRRLEFSAISDSNVRQNIWQRLFNYGTVEVHLFSRENTIFIKNIDHPYLFVEILQRNMKQFRGGIGQ